MHTAYAADAAELAYAAERAAQRADILELTC